MVQLASEAMVPTRAVRLIVLDRDGVVNYDSEHFIKTPDEWRPVPGSLEAIARLNHAGYRVVVATNQSGIGRGLFDMAMLNAIHHRLVGNCSACMQMSRSTSTHFLPPVTSGSETSRSPP